MLKDIDIVSSLGPCYGSIGLVLLGKQASKLLAVKRLDLERAKLTELEAIQRELHLAKTLRHPYLLPINNCFVNDECLYVVSPAAGYGSCADLITNHFQSGLSDNAVAVIVRDVLNALVYLHSRRLIHRAVRARHILVTSSGRALLSCLRHAQYLPHGSTSHLFTENDSDNLNWLAPEVLAQDKEGYDEKSDIYSVAMTVLELVNGEAPFSDLGRTFMLVQKLDGWVPIFTRHVSPGIMQLKDTCSRGDLEFRPSAQQLLHLPFLKVKGELSNLLHPVIPMDSHQVPADSEDLRSIMLPHGENLLTDGLNEPITWTFE